MKIWYRVTITFTMLLVIFALLITGFQLAVYGDSHYGFYKKEYEKYRVTDDLNMKIDNVMAVTEHMMAYLIGKEEKLSIVTDVDGEHQDFFNEQDSPGRCEEFVSGRFEASKLCGDSCNYFNDCS